MKIATVCVYNPMLSLYLEAVKQCFSHWGRFVTVEADFSEVSEEAARNEGLNQVQDCDFVWIIDSDEFMTKHHQEWVLNNAIHYDRAVTMAKLIDYKRFDEAMSPARSHTPIVLMKPMCNFYEGRCANGEKLAIAVELHHFGMVYPENVLKWKAERYWNKSDPLEFGKRLKSEGRPATIPDEIKALLDKYMIKEKGNDDGVRNIEGKERKVCKRNKSTVGVSQR